MAGDAPISSATIRNKPFWAIVIVAILIGLLVNVAILWDAGRVGYPLWLARFYGCLAGTFASALILTIFRFSVRQFLKWYALWALAVVLQAWAGKAATSVYLSGFKHSLLRAATLSNWQELATRVDRLRVRESEIGDSGSSPLFNQGAGFYEFFHQKAAELPAFVSTVFGNARVPIWSVSAVSSPRDAIFVTWSSGAHLALIIHPINPAGAESGTAFSIRHVDGVNRANPNDVLYRELLCEGVEIIIFGDAG